MRFLLVSLPTAPFYDDVLSACAKQAGFYGAAIVELEVGAYIFTDNQAGRRCSVRTGRNYALCCAGILSRRKACLSEIARR